MTIKHNSANKDIDNNNNSTVDNNNN